jgi:hypothetical protein
MLRRVALVRTDVSEELSASFIRVTTVGELGTTLAVTSNQRTPFFLVLTMSRESHKLRSSFRLIKSTHKAMFFSMVQPMTCSTSSDNPLQLIGLHPDNLINTLISPKLQALSAQFHGSEMLCNPHFKV